MEIYYLRYQILLFQFSKNMLCVNKMFMHYIFCMSESGYKLKKILFKNINLQIVLSNICLKQACETRLPVGVILSIICKPQAHITKKRKLLNSLRSSWRISSLLILMDKCNNCTGIHDQDYLKIS